MEFKNPKYQNQGIHLLASIFTIDKGIVKVLLVKRKKEPFKNYWGLVGGALYNDEKLLNGLTREIEEKSGIKNLELKLCNVFDEIESTPKFRMIALSYIGLIDYSSITVLKKTDKTIDADWFSLDEIPTLAYEHNKILNESIEYLKKEIFKTNILNAFYPNGFTIPELQKVTEAILNKKLDRRNFRKKILSFEFIYDTEKFRNVDGKKPAKIYNFKENYDYDKNVF